MLFYLCWFSGDGKLSLVVVEFVIYTDFYNPIGLNSKMRRKKCLGDALNIMGRTNAGNAKVHWIISNHDQSMRLFCSSPDYTLIH